MSPATTRDARPRRTVRSAPLSSLNDANHSVNRRRTRPLYRRTDHSVIERRRREKINDRLLHLQYMVPACRDQAREHFRRKMQDDSDQHIQKALALEKLCIISHTVVLQQQLAAYKAKCGCLPQVPDVPEKNDAHDAYAHDGLTTCSTSRKSPDSSSSSSESKGDDDLEPINSQDSENVTHTSLSRTDSVEHTPWRSMPSLQHLISLEQPRSIRPAGSHHHHFMSAKKATDRMPHPSSYPYHRPYARTLDSSVQTDESWPTTLPASYYSQPWFLRNDRRRCPNGHTHPTYPKLAPTPHKLS